MNRQTITAAEAASQLGVTSTTVYGLIRAGELDGYSVGKPGSRRPRRLVYADAVEEYRQRHAAPKAKPAPGPAKAPGPARAHFKPGARRPAGPSAAPTPFRHFR